MDNVIRLIPIECDLLDSKYDIVVDYNCFDYAVIINIDPNKSFLEELPSKEDFKNISDNIKGYISIFDTSDESDSYHAERLEYIINHNEEIYNSAEYIDFSRNYPFDKIKEYIEKNPILKNKKLVFYAEEDVPFSLYEKIKETFKDETSNIYIKMCDNTMLISFDEYEKTTLKLNEMADEIKSLNLSPFETILYTYDLVRERIYNESNDDFTASRDINSVLFGDNIVCVGYAKIFKALLQRNGIDARAFHLDGISGRSGHLRNEIYVKDDKYDIDGVYFFDSTWDSMKLGREEYFPYTYKFFAKTAEEMRIYDKQNNIKNLDNLDFSYEILDNITEILENPTFENIYSSEVKTINHMSKVIYGKSILPLLAFTSNLFRKNMNMDEINEKVEELISKYNKPISGDIYIKALYNVRKNQYYNHPEKFSLEASDFLNAALLSNWNFLTPEERLLEFIFDEKLKPRNQSQENRKKYACSEIHAAEIPKRVKQVQFTRVLRNIRDSKTR